LFYFRCFPQPASLIEWGLFIGRLFWTRFGTTGEFMYIYCERWGNTWRARRAFISFSLFCLNWKWLPLMQLALSTSC